MRGSEGFVWGVATSSYQIEGHPLADGGGPCTWHEYAHTPGNTTRGETGDVACDHYHRYAEDVALMARLGVGAYRFSIRWPRLLPEGTGRVNQAGIGFYDRLLDRLLAAGITPFPTLYHWDLPVDLEARGGWRSPEMPGWFADYAGLVARRLGDRLPYVATLNEPWVTAVVAYLQGRLAPGQRNLFATAQAIETQILAHVDAYRALKAVRPGMQVGIVLSNAWMRPEGEGGEDRRAADRAHAFVNHPLFLDPLLRGHYPPEIEAALSAHLLRPRPLPSPGATPPVDFVGMNYYFFDRVTADPADWMGYRVVPHPELPETSVGWHSDPQGLHEVLRSVPARYGDLPLYVTENGAAYEDRVTGGAVHDAERLAYLQGHVAAALRARAAGVDLRGYFVWSLLDNYEWSLGYDKRFGIVHVDRETLARTVKDSGLWYARVCRGETVPAATT